MLAGESLRFRNPWEYFKPDHGPNTWAWLEVHYSATNDSTMRDFLLKVDVQPPPERPTTDLK